MTAKLEAKRKNDLTRYHSRREAWLQEHGPCVDCGSWESLEADHLDPATKESHRIWSWTQVRRERELAKCVVRCRPCHLKRHGRGPQHGTISRYRWGKCRCELCRATNAAYKLRSKWAAKARKAA